MYFRSIYILKAVISLFLGLLIYIFFRENIVGVTIFGGEWINMVKINLYYYDDNIFVYCFLYCLSDALWYYSLLMLQLYFSRCFSMSRIFLGLSIILPFILEIMQYFDLFVGTFDFFDIIFYLLIFFIVWKKEKKLFSVLLK